MSADLNNPEFRKKVAEMLRDGASGISSSHQEYCISSDNCPCDREAEEMLATADLLDEGSPEEKQQRTDQAVVAGVRGFPIFDSKEQSDRYFDAAERLSNPPS